MKFSSTLLYMAPLAVAKPKIPILSSEDLPVPSLGTEPIPFPPAPSDPIPIPPVPPGSSPAVPEPPPTETAPGPPKPTITGGPAGPVCECGYTYCASVLQAMKKPWNQKQLSDAYCSTPNVACPNRAPATNVSSALYICLCESIDQKLGNDLDLLCGCDNCQVIGPDYRGRCETPCYGSLYGSDSRPVVLD